MKILISSVFFTFQLALLCGCTGQATSNFLDGAAKGALIATEAQLEAEIEFQKRKLAIQAEKNRILAQRNAVIESKLSKLGTPLNVGVTSIGGRKTIVYTYDSKITINRVIIVLGTPDNAAKENGFTVYRWGSYFASDALGFVMIAKPIE
ncbi:hypothetical protein J4G08_06920 [Candidatus Poribacteria bacterium]|nr:hypothetical protein [Candidatus Poribacteria bacterium]